MLRLSLLVAVSSLQATQGQRQRQTGDAHDTVEKTILQGKDPPGTDEEQGTAPPAEHKGVIPPPPVGDEGIHTHVPNPEAGHKKEVIPPPDPHVSAYVLTGQTVTLKEFHRLDAVAGAYAYTGVSVNFTVVMPAAKGTYVLTGRSVGDWLTKPPLIAIGMLENHKSMEQKANSLAMARRSSHKI